MSWEYTENVLVLQRVNYLVGTLMSLANSMKVFFCGSDISCM